MVRCTILAYLHNNEQNFSRTVAQNCCTDRHLECVFKMSLESLMRVPQDWPILGHVTVASHGKLPVHMPVPGRGGYFAYLCHMIDKELVVFSFLYIKLFEPGVEVALNHWSAVTHHKVICSNSHSGAAALSAQMMLSCCSFASASFTSRNPSSLYVNRLNSKIYTTL